MAVNPLLPDPVSPDPVSGALPLTGTVDLVNYAPASENEYELELSANDSTITTSANYFENNVDAYNVFVEGNPLYQINNYLTEIPSDENIFSFGTVTFTNKTLKDEEGKNIERTGLLRGRGGAIGHFSFNFGNIYSEKLKREVSISDEFNFPIKILQQEGDAPEIIEVGYLARYTPITPYNLKIGRSDVWFDFAGAKIVGGNGGANALDEDERGITIAHDGQFRGSEDLDYSFSVPEGEEIELELFGRTYTTTADYSSNPTDDNSFKITAINPDTGEPGDFETTEKKLVIEGVAKPSTKIDVFYRPEETSLEDAIAIADKDNPKKPLPLGTTESDTDGKWRLENDRYNDVALRKSGFLGGKYLLSATAKEGREVLKTEREIKITDKDFDITYSFSRVPQSSQDKIKGPLDKAIAEWEKVIVGDLPDINRGGVKIDDLDLNIKLGKVADPKNPLAAASGSIEQLRGEENKLPYSGTITVDPSTLNKPKRLNRLKDVLLHEIGHILGFEPKFLEKRDNLLLQEERQLKSVNENEVDGEIIPFFGFKGEKARKVFNELNNDPTFRSSDEYQRLYGQETNVEEVPLAYDREFPNWAHWNEGIFGDELMTPILTSSSNIDLSSQKLTIAAIQDMGYTVAQDLVI